MTKVSSNTAITSKNPNSTRTAILERTRPLNAIAIMIPAVVIITLNRLKNHTYKKRKRHTLIWPYPLLSMLDPYILGHDIQQFYRKEIYHNPKPGLYEKNKKGKENIIRKRLEIHILSRKEKKKIKKYKVKTYQGLMSNQTQIQRNKRYQYLRKKESSTRSLNFK
jgi:hypothetical protein